MEQVIDQFLEESSLSKFPEIYKNSCEVKGKEKLLITFYFYE